MVLSSLKKRSKLKAKLSSRPRLTGLIFPTGLKRVLGNKKLFRKLLLSFRDSNADTSEKIKDALEKGDTELVQRLAHTVRGVSGNFAADNLFEAAGALETAIKNSNTDQYEKLLESFAEELDFIVKSIEDSLEVEHMGEVTAKTDQSVDVKKVKGLLSETKELLEEDFSEAESRLEQLRVILDPSEFQAEYRKMQSQIDGYDFESAMETIDELLKSIEIMAKQGENMNDLQVKKKILIVDDAREKHSHSG